MIMRTTGLDSDQGPTAAKYIVETIKPKRIAVVHDKQQYGEGLARSVRDSLKEQGAEVVLFEGVTAGDKDFDSGCSPEERERRFCLFRRLLPRNGPNSASG